MSKQTFSYLIFAAILRLLSPVRGQVGTEDSSGFFVDSNGVVVCPDAELGATSSLNIGGTASLFTRASREDLMNIVAAAAWPELGKVCTSGITDMSNLFLGQTQFGATDDETLGANVDLSRWDVSSVENMDAMFYDAKSFNKDLSKWDTSMVTSCDKFADRASSWTEPWPVFQNCSPTGRFVLGPNGVTVSCPDAVLMESAYIRNKRYTKRDRDLLEELITARRWSEVAATCTTGIDDLSNLFLGEERFDEDIRSWDVSSVSNMAAMFYGACHHSDKGLSLSRFWHIPRIYNGWHIPR
jgi:surface protein